MENRWGKGPEKAADELDRLVYLSHLIGAEPRLVQPGGGNASVKLQAENPFGEREEILAVKGSGHDLATISRNGFSRLSMARLAHLRRRERMSDEEMMEFMRACMLHPHGDPLPSVEMPLHAVLPGRVIVHTHDVATMSLTGVPDDDAVDLVAEASGGSLLHVPHARPGFDLARAVADHLSRLSDEIWGLAMAHHGMVVWADTAEECYRRLVDLVDRAETFLEARRAGRPAFGPARGASLPEARRRELAEEILPVLRGALGPEERVILHWDDSPRVLEALAGDSFRELSQRGVTTSEHILRAGRRPLWLEIDPEAPAPHRAEAVRAALEASRSEYVEYHRRHAAPNAEPIEDWAKVILVPGLGMVTAFRDKPGAVTANLCYSAVIDTLENAEALGGFRFLSEEEVFFFEHWPLERRKVEETIRGERRSLLLPRHVALILGGASGIGAAAAWRFAEEGAHVVVGDLDGPGAGSLAAEICERYPRRASGLAVDVRDESAIVAAVRQAVLEFGGLDSLFYTPGLAPRFAPLAETGREDLQSQLEVHYLGAMLAIREAAAVMRRQGLGGSILCSVSKAALAPGRNATAYGGSKAALQHALRVAALELGADGIRVNSINADQVETPLFLRFARARAESQGVSLEQQLETYRQRNALRVSLIPPEAVADLAVLLAGERFRFTTGDIITIDGGLADAFPR